MSSPSAAARRRRGAAGGQVAAKSDPPTREGGPNPTATRSPALASAPACHVARDDAERAAHFAIRRAVFCAEQGLFGGGDDRDEREDDEVRHQPLAHVGADQPGHHQPADRHAQVVGREQHAAVRDVVAAVPAQAEERDDQRLEDRADRPVDEHVDAAAPGQLVVAHQRLLL